MNLDLGAIADLSFGAMVHEALALDTDAPVHEIRTPDVFVGRLLDLPSMHPPNEQGRWHTADTDTARHSRPNVQCIVMVLESPHTDEFDPTHCYTPWPANGSSRGTGEKIQKRAQELADLIGAAPDAGLVLLNAIPFQCSQGAAGGAKVWKARRDRIFSHAWAHASTRAHFRARLQHWYQPGDVVINACTAGECRPKLRDLVEAELMEALEPGVKSVRMHHPSGWYKRSLAAHLLV